MFLSAHIAFLFGWPSIFYIFGKKLDKSNTIKTCFLPASLVQPQYSAVTFSCVDKMDFCNISLVRHFGHVVTVNGRSMVEPRQGAKITVMAKI